MRIVIDMQGAQTESRFRGISRYIMAFAQAVARNGGEHEVLLVLSGLFSDTIEPIRAAFEGLLPQENIRVWYVPEKSNLEDTSYQKVNKLIFEAFLSSLNPDVIHFTGSIFNDTNQKTVFSSNLFDNVFPVTVLIDRYDYEYKVKESASREIDEFNYIVEYFYTLFDTEKPDKINAKLIIIDSLRDIDSCHKSCVECNDITQVDEVDRHAVAAIISWQDIAKKFRCSIKKQSNKKPRLAHVSPLPPERSGIADYSAELLPFLSQYYEIDVVTFQEFVDCQWIQLNCRILSTEAFSEVAENYDYILYHFGNNQMHAQMFELLTRFPGVVVLHDFFLSGVQWYREAHGFVNNSLWNELYLAHGYKAMRERTIEHDESVVFRYPCNFSVLQKALGVIVHSENSQRLARQWYNMQEGMSVIPLLRLQAEQINRKQARKQLGILENDFLVCSFGFVGKTKQNHRLLDAWEASALLNGGKHCKLVFVGDTNSSPYVHELRARIRKYRKSGSIQISGWTDRATYRLYLAAADIAVQLRTLSHGETSAAVLDCMNYGLSLIVNANGSMAELDSEAVWMLPDEFTDNALVEALEMLWRNPQRRELMGKRAKAIIQEQHAPVKCAAQYVEAIEQFYCGTQRALPALISQISSNYTLDDFDFVKLSEALARNLPLPQPAKRLFLDITATCTNDLKTGIERVVRALVTELIKSPPAGYRVEPVYLTNCNEHWCYIYARQYTSILLNIPEGVLYDEVADFNAGDIILGLDMSGSSIIDSVQSGYIRNLRVSGVKVYFMVHDLIPVRMPAVFPPRADENYAKWLHAIATTDGIVGVTKHVAEDFRAWLAEKGIHKSRQQAFKIAYSHHGADIESSVPSKGIPSSGMATLNQIQQRPSFLMVGTIEPRKGYAYTLAAFEQLWQKDIDINLIIVGKEGWNGLLDDMRRDIPETINKLRHHLERGKRLFVLEGISDEFLNEVYANSTCLIAASYDEGFGLPLIEAAQHKIPIIARDIPVFREVAGEYAFYFTGEEPAALFEAIQEWLVLYKSGEHPLSDNMPLLTWRESAQQLLTVLINNNENSRVNSYVEN